MSWVGCGGGEAIGVCECWMWLGDWGGEANEGGEGERWPKRRGGGSTLAELAVTLMAAL
jgi:hypothetical protein